MPTLIRTALIAIIMGLIAPAAHAQTPGVAVMALHQGDLFAGFVGPFRATTAGIDFNFVILCLAPSTRHKVTVDVVVSIPDGTPASQVVPLMTTRGIARCAEYGITVARAAVRLPVFQQGQ